MAHVFVVRGDLKLLACDAWLVPGGNGPGGTWRPALPPRSEWREPPPEYLVEDAAGGRLRTFLLAETYEPDPLPFLTDIVGGNRHSPEWYVEGARQFIAAAVDALRARKREPVHGRAKYLLALPLAGTGGGGGGMSSGEVVQLMLRMLRVESERFDVDAALVLYEGPAWAAAQHERNLDEDISFSDLSPRLKQHADDLALRARAGDLVLFLGAGISQAAGLPSWSALLSDLAAERAQLSDTDRIALERLGELDRAAIIKRRLQEGTQLGHAVAELLRVRSRRHAIAHSLLASLPVEEVITTNYDTLFEDASASIDRQCTVLPGGAVARGRRWLLKMHGCVTRPETIVLTREDYLKFQENRTALAGIVQALLLTRHMLFVGFSLTDDNFHRIAHAVRNAMQLTHGAHPRFGTALVVGGNPLAEELWGDDLDWVTLDKRELEIFLDRMASRAVASTAHLGDPKYDGALTAGERALRDRLQALAGDVTDHERTTGAWAEVERTLRRLGIKRGG